MRDGVDNAGSGVDRANVIRDADGYRSTERKGIHHIHITAVTADVPGLRWQTHLRFELGDFSGGDEGNARRTAEIEIHGGSLGTGLCSVGGSDSTSRNGIGKTCLMVFAFEAREIGRSARWLTNRSHGGGRLPRTKKFGHAGGVFGAAGPLRFVGDAERLEHHAQSAFVMIKRHGAVTLLDLGADENCRDTAATPVTCAVAF